MSNEQSEPSPADRLRYVLKCVTEQTQAWRENFLTLQGMPDADLADAMEGTADVPAELEKLERAYRDAAELLQQMRKTMLACHAKVAGLRGEN